MRRTRSTYSQSQFQEEEQSSSMNLGTFFIPITVTFFGLLLFFMFKASVSENELAKTKSETKALLEGRITKKEKEKLDTDKVVLKKAFTGLASLRDVIDEKFIEINEMIKEVEIKKSTIDNIIKSNNKQAIVVANFKSIIAEKNKLLEMKENAIAMLNQKLVKGEEFHQATIARLNRNLRELEDSKEKIQVQLATINSLKNKNSFLAKVSSQKDTLLSNVKTENNKLNYVNNLLTVSNEKYQKDNYHMNLQTKVLNTKLAEAIDSNKNLMVKNDQYKFVRDRLLGFNKELKSKLTSTHSGRKIASVENSVRDHLVDKMVQTFKNSAYSVEVNPVNGNLILKSKRGYLFRKNSYNLTRESKNILRKVIPMYTKVLFEDEKIGRKVASINIVGHSSPTFNKKFVHPAKDAPRAYAFNIKLSSLRATKLTEFIFSREMGNFPHKSKMREVVFSSGRGYSDSILKTTEPNKKECNLYDCQGSRRVELSFSLKNGTAGL